MRMSSPHGIAGPSSPAGCPQQTNCNIYTASIKTGLEVHGLLLAVHHRVVGLGGILQPLPERTWGPIQQFGRMHTLSAQLLGRLNLRQLHQLE